MTPIITQFALFVRFWQVIFIDFYKKDCLTRACALTYTTLLAMVPLMFVFVSMLSIIPAFSKLPQTIQHFIFTNFVPSTGHAVENYIQSTLARASSLPVFSLVFLVATALMLMLSIESNLNGTWGIKFTRRLSMSILLYWSVLTLGPLLLASSLLLSSYFSAITWLFQLPLMHVNLMVLLPFLVTFFGFWFIYLIVPHTKVNLYYAAIGALIAALLFELAKHLFSFYVIYFPTYQKLYGFLATIPLFLFWVYCCWVIFLLGGLIVNTLRLGTVWHAQQKAPSFLIAIAVLQHLYGAQQDNASTPVSTLLATLKAYNVIQSQRVIDDLLGCGMISQDHDSQLRLYADCHQTTVAMLCEQLHYYLPSEKILPHSALPAKLIKPLKALDKHKHTLLDVSLAEVFNINGNK